MNTLRWSVAALTLITVSAAVALLAQTRRAERREDLKDRATLLAQSQDMMAEGGPAEA